MYKTVRFAVVLSWFLLACGSDNGNNNNAPAGPTVKFASLTGPEETPPTTSTAIGRGVLVVDESTGAAMTARRLRDEMQG